MWRVKPDENPDWGYARNKQILLKTPIAEYSASIFTAPLKISNMVFYGGNMDYSWQGLLVGPLRGTLYKVLDSVYFCLPDLILQPKDVIFDLNKCIYNYKCVKGGEISVELALRNVADAVLLDAATNQPCWFTILLDPMSGGRWTSNNYNIRLADTQLVVTPTAIPLQIIVEGFNQSEPLNLELEWRYKLGDGFRKYEDGLIRFVEHFRKIYVPFMLYSSKGSLRIKVPISEGILTNYPKPNVEERLRLGKSMVADAVYLRFKTLSTYSIFANGVWFPEAGAWWFRKPWIRDALEGIRWNLKTYLEVFGWGRSIISTLDYLLDTLKSSGGLPIIMGITNQFTSDAPPQLLYIASKISEMLGNRTLFLKLLNVARSIAERLAKGHPVSTTMLQESVLCSPANSSWTDSIITTNNTSWPTRLPYEWMKCNVNPRSSEFGLVEVNALYIEALETLTATCRKLGVEVPEEVEELSQILKKGFIKYFKDNEKLPPLTVAPSYGLTDATVGSPAVVAASVLRGILYNDEELRGFWRTIARRLLVYRKLMVLGKETHPFGILVKDVNRTPYLGDKEYHEATIWPRDTPYLLKLMDAVGEDVTGLLISNLDHMVSEGVIGYCGELFSLPIGENPNPCPESENPVPVKNPAQYWSHWCDPYLKHLSKLI